MDFPIALFGFFVCQERAKLASYELVENPRESRDGKIEFASSYRCYGMKPFAIPFYGIWAIRRGT